MKFKGGPNDAAYKRKVLEPLNVASFAYDIFAKAMQRKTMFMKNSREEKKNYEEKILEQKIMETPRPSTQ